MLEKFLPISFEYPYILWLLIFLPIIFFISKLSPKTKAKAKGKFAGFFILEKLSRTPNIPQNAPIWLKLTRLLFCACLIFGLAQPNYKPEKSGIINGQKILIIIENDVALSNEIENINNQINLIISQNENSKSEIIIAPIFDKNNIFSANKHLKPKNIKIDAANYKIDRSILIPKLESLKGNFEIHYFANLISGNSDYEFYKILNQLSNNNISLHQPTRNFATIKGVFESDNSLKLNIFSTQNIVSTINAYNKNGQLIANFKANPNNAHLALPYNKISQIAYFEIEGQNNAGKIFLIDKNLTKPIIATQKLENSEQPLISDAHFIWSSLKIFANPQNIEFEKIQKQNPNAIIFGDNSGFSINETRILKNYMENGGTIIRFLGAKSIANPNDEILSANISNEIHNITSGFGVKTVTFVPFEKSSIFSTIKIPQDIMVQSIIHFANSAQPDEILAQLSDGSPYISTKNFGRGKLYIFHVNAAPIWSNGSLSSFHLELLKKIISQTQNNRQSAIELKTPTNLRQTIEIDKNGNLNRDFDKVNLISTPISSEINANDKLSAGLYEGDGISFALNIGPSFNNSNIQNIPNNFKLQNIRKQQSSFSEILLSIAFILLFIDIIFTFFVAVNFQKIFKLTILLLSIFNFYPDISNAQNASLKDDLKLAYIITNDDLNNENARLGLKGLANALEQRTNIEPNGTIGINIEKDELAKHPIIYWLIPKQGMEISQKSRDALNKYMQNGGIIFIDNQGLGMDKARAQANLKKALNGLKIPPLEIVPAQHVLKKSFYLLVNFQGFYKNSSLWVESSASQNSSSNDGVSPIIISDGNFARLWANPESQSISSIFSNNFDNELGIRAGINIYIYALTGQYKNDQIHINSVLNRLNRGQE